MSIQLKGLREHNLKGFDLSLPRNELIVVTGPSGSGKSSLVFDTIFAEGQAEFLDSIGTFARRFTAKASHADIDSVSGLSPVVLVDQRPLGRSPRSTVGTSTEIYTFLRLLFSRCGSPHLTAGEFSFNNPVGACELCHGLGLKLTVDEDQLIDWTETLSNGAIRHRTFKVGGRYWNIIKATGLFNMDKPVGSFGAEDVHTLLYASPTTYKNNEPGFVQRFTFEGVANRILGRQRDDRGLEIRDEDARFLRKSPCDACHGARVSRRALDVRFAGHSISYYATMPLSQLINATDSIKDPAAVPILENMRRRICSMLDLGLGYLDLSRSVDTLSGGESQRVKLARQLGSNLCELIYILDEPTSGLHARDVDHLLSILRRLQEKPNTLIVVEHDLTVTAGADHIVEVGPGAGVAGGYLVAQGRPRDLELDSGSLTGAYLSGRRSIAIKSERRVPDATLELLDVTENNLVHLDIRLPVGVLVCVTGVSGSGKSSLVAAVMRRRPDMILIDQAPPAESPRSVPATYVDAFDLIRSEFARANQVDRALFSFNSEGACPVCKGLGYQKLDLHFLEDIRPVCEECNGCRYKPEVLSLLLRGRSIVEVLDMTAEQSLEFFVDDDIVRRLSLLVDVGLGYLTLGQPIDSLSGGEAQRVKLCKYLAQKGEGFILDEPTRGLHSVDIDRLLDILNRLVDSGNSVLLVEHNLDVIKNADWIIDLGPEGGANGGRVVAQGTPEQVSQESGSVTASYLLRVLNPDPTTRNTGG